MHEQGKRPATPGAPDPARGVVFAVGGLLGLLVISGMTSGLVMHDASAKGRSGGGAKAATLPALSALAAARPSASIAPKIVPESAVASASAVAPVAPSSAMLNVGVGTRVLVFGDSMVDAGFAQRLKTLVEARGGTLVHDAWTSSSTSSWSKGDRLTKLLALAPDVVIVALGANEVSLPSPESNAGAVRAIVARIASRAPGECLWVGPAVWKGETGIVGVERKNASPCGFFDSGSLTLERRRDGIHTTMKGGTAWADAVWAARVSPATTEIAGAASAQVATGAATATSPSAVGGK